MRPVKLFNIKRLHKERPIASLRDGYLSATDHLNLDVIEVRVPATPMVGDAYRNTPPVDLTGDWGAHERSASFAGEALSSSGSRKTMRPPTGRDSS